MKRLAAVALALALAGCGDGKPKAKPGPDGRASHPAKVRKEIKRVRDSDIPKDAQQQLEEAQKLLDDLDDK